MSLRVYFILVFGIGTIFFLFLVSTLLFNRMESIIVEQISNTFNIETTNKIKEVNQKIYKLNKKFVTMTQLPIFSSMRFYSLTLNEAALKNDIRQLELYFRKIVSQSDELIEVSYIDANAIEVFQIKQNQIISKLSNLSNDKKIIQNLQLNKGDVAHTLNYRHNQIASISWWIPVYVLANTKLGVMVFTVDFDVFKSSIIEMFPPSNSNLCINDSKGKLIISNTKPYNCIEDLATPFRINDEINIDNLTWNISVINNTEAVFEKVDELRAFIFYKILPLISLIAFVFTYIFSHRLLSTINNLVEYVKTIGKSLDVYSTDIDTSRKDELGILAREMKRSNKLITDNRKKLEDTNNELESYSYTLAHDLRSPLRSISSFSQILEMESAQKLNEEELGFLSRIIKASKRMSNLIDDILELSRISSKTISLDDINLSDIANSVIENLKVTYEDNLDLEIYIQSDMKTKGDAQLFKIILENLLGNAWKYSSKNDTIFISFKEKIVDGKRVYEIQDRGTGFDMAYVEKLFKPFQRLHKSEDFEGTGVGLASVKRMIEKHAGEIWITSKVGQGTTVSFTLWN